MEGEINLLDCNTSNASSEKSSLVIDRSNTTTDFYQILLRNTVFINSQTFEIFDDVLEKKFVEKFHFLADNKENNNIKNNLDSLLKQIRLIDDNSNMENNTSTNRKNKINNKKSYKTKQGKKKITNDENSVKYKISLPFDEEIVAENQFDKNNFLNVKLNFLRKSTFSRSVDPKVLKDLNNHNNNTLMFNSKLTELNDKNHFYGKADISKLTTLSFNKQNIKCCHSVDQKILKDLNPTNLIIRYDNKLREMEFEQENFYTNEISSMSVLKFENKIKDVTEKVSKNSLFKINGKLSKINYTLMEEMNIDNQNIKIAKIANKEKEINDNIPQIIKNTESNTMNRKNLAHIYPLKILPKVKEFLDINKYYNYYELLNYQKAQISIPLPKQNLHESLRILTRMLNFQSAKESNSLLQKSNLDDDHNNKIKEDEERKREEKERKLKEEEQKLKEEELKLKEEKEKERKLKEEEQKLKEEELKLKEEKERKLKEEEQKQIEEELKLKEEKERKLIEEEQKLKEEEQKLKEEKERKLNEEEQKLKQLQQQQLIEEEQIIKDNDREEPKDEVGQEKNREEKIRKLFELEIKNLSKILPKSEFKFVYEKLTEFNTKLQESGVLDKVQFEELYNKVFNFEIDVKNSKNIQQADLSNLRSELESHELVNRTKSYTNKLMPELSDETFKYSFLQASFKPITHLSDITLLKKSEPIIFDNTGKIESNLDKIVINDAINYKIPELVNHTFCLLDINLNPERNLQNCVEIFKFIESEFSNISKVTKLFDYDVKKLSLFINENYIKDDDIQIKNLDHSRKSKLFHFVSKTLYFYDHIKTSIDFLVDENSKLRSKLKSNLPSELEKMFKTNVDLSHFIWKKNCHVHNVLYDVLKQKNHLALKNAVDFNRFLRETSLPKLELYDNHLLHNPPNFHEMKNSLTNLRTIENEFNKCREQIKSIEHNRSRVFFNDENFKLDRRLNFSEIQYKNYEENKNVTPKKKEKLNITNLFSSNEKSRNKKNEDIIKSMKGVKIKSIQALKEDLFSVDNKLQPIEEEFREYKFAKNLKTVCESKSYYVNFINVLVFAFIIIFVSLNLYKFFQRNDFSFTTHEYISPIESILPEGQEKERIILTEIFD